MPSYCAPADWRLEVVEAVAYWAERGAVPVEKIGQGRPRIGLAIRRAGSHIVRALPTLDLACRNCRNRRNYPGLEGFCGLCGFCAVK